MVSDQFSDAVIIDYLELRERRLVNSISIDEFEDNKYHKLPKDWIYNTDLYEIKYTELSEEEKSFKWDIKKPEIIKDAYNRCYLVKSETIFHGVVEAEITKEGYRITKKYPYWKHNIDYVSIRPDKVYFTYDEAEKEVQANINEFKRQAELSDYDQSVEQIDKTLGRWKNLTSTSDLDVQQIRNEKCRRY